MTMRMIEIIEKKYGMAEHITQLQEIRLRSPYHRS